MALRSVLSTEMPTITLSEAGKALEGAVRFVFAHDSFELEKEGKLTTDDTATVAEAANHPYLSIDYSDVKSGAEESEELAKQAVESEDPHVNRTLDHLSDVASREAVKAAQDNAERQRALAAGKQIQQTTLAEPATSRGAVSAQVTRSADPVAQAAVTDSNEEDN